MLPAAPHPADDVVAFFPGKVKQRRIPDKPRDLAADGIQYVVRRRGGVVAVVAVAPVGHEKRNRPLRGGAVGHVPVKQADGDDSTVLPPGRQGSRDVDPHRGGRGERYGRDSVVRNCDAEKLSTVMRLRFAIFSPGLETNCYSYPHLR